MAKDDTILRFLCKKKDAFGVKLSLSRVMSVQSACGATKSKVELEEVSKGVH